jgi:hypothetical protein
MAQGDYDHAVALHEEAMAVCREMGHKQGVSASLRELGFVAYEQADYERAVRLHEQSLALAREFATMFGTSGTSAPWRTLCEGREISYARVCCWKRAWLCLVARRTRGASRARWQA